MLRRVSVVSLAIIVSLLHAVSAATAEDCPPTTKPNSSPAPAGSPTASTGGQTGPPTAFVNVLTQGDSGAGAAQSSADDYIISSIPQGSRGTFRCPAGSTFNKVEFAGWGVYHLTSNGQFNVDPAKNCHKDVREIVSRACIGQPQCMFEPDPSQLGQSCAGAKSLAVKMQCQAGVTANNVVKILIPEHRQMTLSCKPDEIMVGIDFASYGRQLVTSSGFQPDPTYNCNSEKSRGIVEQRCLWMNSCRLNATNNIFDDPCRNVLKTLAVQARCASAAGFPKKNMVFIINEHAKQTLQCPNGKFGKVIWAGWGKQYRDVDGFKVDPQFNCNSAKPHMFVQKKCQGRSKCVIEASNDNFDDPCKKVIKTLGIEIECISF